MNNEARTKIEPAYNTDTFRIFKNKNKTFSIEGILQNKR
jgi:hypothetical protein